MDVEGLDPGIGIPVDPAASPEEKLEEEEPRDELGIQKEDEEPSDPTVESLESSEVIPAEDPGVAPGTSPSAGEAPAVSPGVTQPSTELEKTPAPEAGKSSQETPTERKSVPKIVDAPGKKLDVAGAEREGTVEESTLRAGGENPGKILGKAGTELEKPPGKSSSKGVENSGNAVGEIHTGSSGKIPQNKGVGAAKPDVAAPGSPSASLKESGVGKTFLKVVVSVPDIMKQRIPVRITDNSLGKAGEHKIPPKAVPEKKIPHKTAGAGSSQGKGNGNSGADGQGDSGKGSNQQEKDSQLESRATSKQSQQGEGGTPGTREDPSRNQVRRAGFPGILQLWNSRIVLFLPFP